MTAQYQKDLAELEATVETANKKLQAMRAKKWKELMRLKSMVESLKWGMVELVKDDYFCAKEYIDRLFENVDDELDEWQQKLNADRKQAYIESAEE